MAATGMWSPETRSIPAGEPDGGGLRRERSLISNPMEPMTNDQNTSAGPDAPEPDSDGAPRETHRVTGDRLLETVRRIVREGNVRRIVIRNDDDRVLLSFPLSAGVVGAALLPIWAAVGAVAALVGNCSIDVERTDEA